MKTTKKKTTKKKVAKKVAVKAAASELDALDETAKQIAGLEKVLKIERQKSNFAILDGKTKVLVIFGSRTKLKIRSRFFGDKERDVKNRTLLLRKPSDSQILSTSRVLVQRALKQKEEVNK